MKLQILLISIITLFTLSNCSRENKVKCKLTGEISDRKDGNLFLYRPESSRFDKDTIPFKDGQFEHSITINSPELYWLFFEEDENDNGGFTSIELFIEQGTVQVEMSFKNINNYQVIGGIHNKNLLEIKKRLISIENDIINAYDELSHISDSAQIQTTKLKADSLSKLYEKNMLDYIAKNTNLASAYFLWSSRHFFGKDTLETLFPALKLKFSNSRYIIETNAYIEGFGKNKPQQQFTDFKLLNRDGVETSLAEIINNNKATFILFWSSRCGFSDGKLKAFKPIYNEYKDFGFEIIGISDDFDLNRWKKAIKRNEADWTNFVDLDGKNAIDEYYHSNTEGDVLIDNSGKILARNVRTSQLKELLEEILK